MSPRTAEHLKDPAVIAKRAASNSKHQKALNLPQRKKDITGERLKLIEDTTERIKSMLSAEDVKYKDLAELLNITQGHVSHLMSGNRNMTLVTLADIGEALGYRFTIIPHKIENE